MVTFCFYIACLTLFIHSLWFVNCVVFISLIELLHVSVLSASLQGLLSWVFSNRNDSLARKLLGYWNFWKCRP